MFPLTRRELVLVGLLVGLLLLGTGVYWWRSQSPVAIVEPPRSTGTMPLTTAESKSTANTPPKPADITIHLNGAVHQPGLYTLAAGSRISDAIRAAGGSLPEADLDAVNLAAPVLDGQKYTIPIKGQALPPTATTPTAGDKININIADGKTLEQLPGIGEARAKAIIEYRQKNGAFQSVEDLKKISGIGDKILEQLRDRVTTR